MTIVSIVEVIAPVSKGTARDKILAVMYYASRFEATQHFSVDDIRALLRRARIPKVESINISDVLAKAVPLVHSPGQLNSRILWDLTPSGLTYAAEKLGVSEVAVELENEVSGLTAIASRIWNREARDYVDEAIKCLMFGALRASVVFLWAGATRILQERVFLKGVSAVNAALQSHDQKARTLKSLDDFAYVKDSNILMVAEDLGILDRNQRQMLEQALELRNKSGHPGKYSPGPNKVAAFIEDVVQIVLVRQPSTRAAALR
jgi:hypothetical protein